MGVGLSFPSHIHSLTHSPLRPEIAHQGSKLGRQGTLTANWVGFVELFFIAAREEILAQWWATGKTLQPRVHKACVAKILKTSVALRLGDVGNAVAVSVAV